MSRINGRRITSNGLTRTIDATTTVVTNIPAPELELPVSRVPLSNYTPTRAPTAKPAFGLSPPVTDASAEKMSGAPFPNAMNVTP
jgi:hypothetical protein